MTIGRKVWTGVAVLAAVGMVVVLALTGNRPGELGEGATPRGGAKAADEAAGNVEAPLQGAETADAVRRPSWTTRYQASDDYFSFAKEAANAAMLGDARAQYVLSEALLECRVQVGLLTPMLTGTVPETIDAYFAQVPNASEQGRRAFKRKVLRCERFFTGSPLAGLSLPEEAQSHQYWFDRAVEAGDPLAVMDRAAKSIVGESPGDANAQARHDAIVQDVRVAVASREAAALLKIGWLYSQPRVAHDFTQGPAWLVAACQAGYDCSNANPEIGHGCVEAGTCDAGLTLLDAFQRDLGAAKFAAIYATSQDILYKVNQGDWEGLQPYVETRM